MTTQIASETEQLILDVLQEAVRCGVKEFCICPGARNAPFIQALVKIPQLKQYYWFEERSAAFFALGRSRETQLPVAVITTSGTAAGELLPAAMEAYYSGVPLLLITADRPRHYRNTGAPQAAEQKGLFGVYTTSDYDVAIEESFSLRDWEQNGPAHLNVCIDEPLTYPFEDFNLNFERQYFPLLPKIGEFDSFFDSVTNPFVVVSTLQKEKRQEVIDFLEKLNAPVYLEGVSGLRGHPRLNHLEICCPDRIWERSRQSGYPIDAVLRIGGVPTFRSWRDLEQMEGQLRVLSINHVLFSGLSWGNVIRCGLNQPPRFHPPKEWLESDKAWQCGMERRFHESPHSEVGLFYHLSKIIPEQAMVYLGNSLPIREWDLAAVRSRHDLEVRASRGVNGIDGQISTFLGMCAPGRSNWGIFGDLTTLYDMAGPWILKALRGMDITIVVVNNSGGQIFASMFKDKELLNEHNLQFEPLAQFWGMNYERWTKIPNKIYNNNISPTLIELIPDN